MSQRTKHIVGWILGLAYYAVSLNGCGPTKPGVVFGELTEKFEVDLGFMLCLQAENLHDESWPDAARALNITIVGYYQRRIECEGSVIGCTHRYPATKEYLVETTLRDDEFIEDTSIPHEFLHIYSYYKYGDDDGSHSRGNVWSTRAYVFERMKHHRNDPTYRLDCAN